LFTITGPEIVTLEEVDKIDEPELVTSVAELVELETEDAATADDVLGCDPTDELLERVLEKTCAGGAVSELTVAWIVAK
jgi:hypothetical protein